MTSVAPSGRGRCYPGNMSGRTRTRLPPRGLRRIVAILPAVALLAAACARAPRYPAAADPEPWFRAADTAVRFGYPARADTFLDRAAAAAAALPPAVRGKARWRLATARFWLAYDRGFWQQARAWADTAAALKPRAVRSLLVRGLALAGSGDRVGAGNVVRELDRRERIEAYLRYRKRWIRAVAALAEGRPRDAFYWLEGTTPLPHDSHRFHRDLALAAELVGDAVSARRYHRYAFEALALPDSAVGARWDVVVTHGGKRMELPVWVGRDGRFLAGSLWGYARSAAESCLAAAGPRRLHWSDRAVPALGRCLRWRIEPHAARAWRGRVNLAVGADALALPDLRREARWQLRTGRPDAALLADFGRLLNRRGRFGAALSMLQAATAADSSDARAWSDLGYALLQVGRQREGTQALDRALALDPDLAVAWYNRGLARYRRGDLDGALADLEHAARLAPDDPAVAELLQRIARRKRREAVAR